MDVLIDYLSQLSWIVVLAGTVAARGVMGVVIGLLH